MNTIEKFELNYVCDKCKKEITLDSSNILPDKLVGWFEDEFLTWYCKCPKCKSINELGNIEIGAIPREVKLELLDRYSGIADETMGIWLNEKKIFDAGKEIKRLNDKINNTTSEIKNQKVKSLYKTWKPNTEIVK